MSTDAVSLYELEAALGEAYGPDRGRLRTHLKTIRKLQRDGRPSDRSIAKLQLELDQSKRRRQQRLDERPPIEYDDSLPIHARRSEIAAAIVENPVVIVCGETGSGKSTQLPKICLEMGRGVDALIGHTQPRRIAARSVAARVADELKRPLGRDVGFQVRFAEAIGPQTYIKLMTDGILLAETRSDRQLRRYDTLIIDEAHERSLNIDFLMAYLKRLLPERRDLRLIITSATIDADRFAEHFATERGPAPVIHVSGRSYPVEIVYRPQPEGDRERDDDPFLHFADIVEEALAQPGGGDLLAFLPTERDIHEASKVLRGRLHAVRHRAGGVEILPLYARLSVQEQQRVFETGKARRIVLATNVAESSLTVPNIRYVVDTGLARLSRYSPRSKLQRLPIEPVSQASANQRAGRCGRVGPGVCYRLFAQEDLETRERFTAPEIQRTNLASVILQTESLQLGHVDQLPLLDPPKPDAIRDGYRTLFELGAVDEEQRLTEMGKKLGRLPVDPRVARMILAGQHEGCLADLLIIAAGLEVQDPRERPLEKRADADVAHSRYADPDSDFLSYLKLWDFYHNLKRDISRNQLRKACKQNFLNETRLREWVDVHRELVDLATEFGAKSTTRHGDSRAIHRALLTGLLSNIALKMETGEYQAAGNLPIQLWPGSGLSGKKPKWIMAAELVETSRRFLRTAARIDPGWIESLAPHLVKTTYAEPVWDSELRAAMSSEKVLLYGLPVVPRRAIRFATIDPGGARRMFISRALVEGDFRDPPEFLAQNLTLVQELRAVAVRMRRPQMILDDDGLFDFYDRRLPLDVWDGDRLERWLRREKPEAKPSLVMTRRDVLRDDEAELTEHDFPRTLKMHQWELPLEYRLDPGCAKDGMTITIPQAALNQVDAVRLGWLVPGLIVEKIAELIRSLPKDLRRMFVPIPDAAALAVDQLPFGEGDLRVELAKELERQSRLAISPSLLVESSLPDHLRVNVVVVDANGAVLGEGRDLQELQRRLGAGAARTFANVDDPRHRQSGMTQWTCGPLEERVTVQRDGLEFHGFPSLVDEGSTVGAMLCDSAERAAWEHLAGVRRLARLVCQREIRQHVEWLPQLNTWTQQAAGLPQPLPVRDHVGDLLAGMAFCVDAPLPRNREQFAAWIERGRERLSRATSEFTPVLKQTFDLAREARRQIEGLARGPHASLVADMASQWTRLLEPGFLVNTPWEWLSQYPRYLNALVARIRKVREGAAARDAAHTATIKPLWQRWVEREADHRRRGIFDAELTLYRWWLEELRVGLFAQDLGTKVTVSEKRLLKQWDRVRE